jgi:hypothetical protein
MYRGKSAECGRLRTRQNSFTRLESRFSQVSMHVNKAGQESQFLAVNNLFCIETSAYFTNDPIFD